jgi:hypothetical protein
MFSEVRPEFIANSSAPVPMRRKEYPTEVAKSQRRAWCHSPLQDWGA